MQAGIDTHLKLILWFNVLSLYFPLYLSASYLALALAGTKINRATRTLKWPITNHPSSIHIFPQFNQTWTQNHHSFYRLHGSSAHQLWQDGLMGLVITWKISLICNSRNFTYKVMDAFSLERSSDRWWAIWNNSIQSVFKNLSFKWNIKMIMLWLILAATAVGLKVYLVNVILTIDALKLECHVYLQCFSFRIAWEIINANWKNKYSLFTYILHSIIANKRLHFNIKHW